MASATESSPVDGRRKAAAARRRERKAQIVAATREIFDERGVRDVQIEHIAKAVGINRAIVYRHFSGKEELFAETLVGYLGELHDAMQAAADSTDAPREQLAAIVGAFVDYGCAHPAFVDCAQQLMLRPGDELLDEIAEGALYRLGVGITSCLTILSDVLSRGAEAGAFEINDDASVLANMLYASGLGALQLARLGILVTEKAPGVPVVDQVSSAQVRDHLVRSALALVLPQPA
ncbi:TetR/AcrR family transcriptional regulator [Nocardioides panacisoli]|uniref:TetR/AcrR family transcriptional regulator n=1 Tax=Nocardioides panacisoli TaxID=627624 RepID=UPI001C62B52A|nr:TetR/AcrR family transcriptional regulator [Nocardioides panacisoli]QYJ04855.1 TetR/AcrR family transcriptional regulator [Nocardioides panacisoli]